eukprot:scpid95867/ scgid20510/ 
MAGRPPDMVHLLGCSPDEQEATREQQGVQVLLDGGSLHLRKWRSNSNAVLESIPEEDRAPDAMVAIEPDKMGLTSGAVDTLGVSGSVEDDAFTFPYHPPERLLQTKQTVLAKMASILNPSGQRSPITIRARNMLQDLCLLGVDWDDQLPRKEEQRWIHWFAERPKLGKIKINRCFKDSARPASEAKLTLHTFTDASDDAIAAASYVRVEYPEGDVKVTLAFAKARAAPIKRVTITNSVCSRIV